MDTKRKIKIFFDEEFRKMAIQKALEMVREDKFEDILDSRLGKLKIYIDKEPKLNLAIFKDDQQCPELRGKIIYIGGS